MDTRTLWEQELDENPAPVEDVAGTPEEPGSPTAADPVEDDHPTRRKLGWLAATVVLALLLMTLGWWLNHDGGGSASASGPDAAQVGEVVSDPNGSTAGGSGTDVTGGSGVTAGSGGTSTGIKAGAEGAAGAKGAKGAAGKAATAPGGGTNPGGGGATDDGTGLKAAVGVKVGSSGVDSGVDLGVATAPGGAVTAVSVTSCATIGNLNPKLDAEAEVTFANGYEATGVKVSGLTLRNLLDPNNLKVTVGGVPYTVPANVDVKVGLCLGL